MHEAFRLAVVNERGEVHPPWGAISAFSKIHGAPSPQQLQTWLKDLKEDHSPHYPAVKRGRPRLLSVEQEDVFAGKVHSRRAHYKAVNLEWAMAWVSEAFDLKLSPSTTSRLLNSHGFSAH